jgi:hypothetical protein
MKKFLPGILGVLLALSCTAFMIKKEKKQVDPCSEDSKKWYVIKLDCNGEVNLSDLRNPQNYKVSSTQEVTGLCQGSSCVCSIWACPGNPPNQDLPNIGSGTRIYTELYNYFIFHDPITGSVGGDVLLKDQP